MTTLPFPWLRRVALRQPHPGRGAERRALRGRDRLRLGHRLAGDRRAGCRRVSGQWTRAMRWRQEALSSPPRATTASGSPSTACGSSTRGRTRHHHLRRVSTGRLAAPARRPRGRRRVVRAGWWCRSCPSTSRSPSAPPGPDTTPPDAAVSQPAADARRRCRHRGRHGHGRPGRGGRRTSPSRTRRRTCGWGRDVGHDVHRARSRCPRGSGRMPMTTWTLSRTYFPTGPMPWTLVPRLRGK